MSAVYNITVNQHADFIRSYRVREDGTILDLTGYTVEASLKQNYTTDEVVDFTFELTDAATGVFTLKLTDTQTGAMTAGNWVYDVVMTSPQGIKTRLMEGKAFVKSGVTV